MNSLICPESFFCFDYFSPMSFERKIIHVDMDSFFASVEIRDRPELAEKPVAIGGKSKQRGVLSTCNYVARTFGLHSAMPTVQAFRKCPNLVLIPGNMPKYKEVSEQIQSIFKRYTTLVEPLSLDEAFLDVSLSDDFNGNPAKIATDIRTHIFEETGLTASAGIAPNKFLAKIASDWNKPNGQFEIHSSEIDSFLHSLPIEKIWGVGKKSAQKLHAQSIHTCGDLKKQSLEFLQNHYGKSGQHLFFLSRGIDNRTVSGISHRKSLSVERTFAKDLCEASEIKTAFDSIYEEFLKRLDLALQKDKALKKSKTCYVKLRLSNFQSFSMERSFSDLSRKRFFALFNELRQKHPGKIRLFGIGIRFAERKKIVKKKKNVQVDLFESNKKSV